MTEYDLAFYAASLDETPEQAVKAIALAASASRRPYVCMGIHGYDDDPRELYDIPEVRAWCKRFVELGGLDYLPSLENGPPGSVGSIIHDHLMLLIAGHPTVQTLGGKPFFNAGAVAKVRKQYSKAN
jgi:hypothetical protein